METPIIQKEITVSNKKQNIPDIINSMNFDRIKYKMSLKESLNWSKAKIDHAELEYKRYLTLIKLYPGKRIVPSKTMDEFWHMHILDTKAYREDCERVFGYFIDHFPYFGIYGEEDYQNLVNEFEETKTLYHELFSYEIGDSDASRCEDHACHKESSCACRTQGACK